MESVYKILYVSPSQESAEKVEMMLLGFDFVHAKSREEAFELIDKEKVSLLIVDLLDIQVFDGVDFCQDLKSKPEYLNLPIIFISDENNSESIIRGFQVGGSDCIKKPFSSDELQIRIGIQLRILEYSARLVELKELKTVNNMIETYNHEINNPLTIAMGFAGLLNPTDPKEKEALQKINKAHDRIFKIVQEVGKIYKTKESTLGSDQTHLYDIAKQNKFLKTGS